MTCPNDKTELKQITKENVVIDFCPTCRGVWLEMGELEKIIDRAINEYGNQGDRQPPTPPRIQGSHFLGALFDLDETGVENKGFFKDRK